MITVRKLLFAVLAFQFLAISAYAAVPWTLNWIDSAGQRKTVPVAIAQLNGLILIAAKTPVDAVEATTVVDDNPTKVLSKVGKGFLIVYLKSSTGKIGFKTRNGQSLIFGYSLNEHPAELRLSKACLDHG